MHASDVSALVTLVATAVALVVFAAALVWVIAEEVVEHDGDGWAYALISGTLQVVVRMYSLR